MEINVNIVSKPNNVSNKDNIEKESEQVIISFDNILNSQVEKKEEVDSYKNSVQESEKLVEDILSLFKTGLTSEELEALEEMLKKIKEKMSEKNVDLDEIKEMFDDLEKMIAKLKAKVSGIAITKVDENDTNSSNSSDLSSFSSKLKDVTNDISELKKTFLKPNMEQFYTQSELLKEILSHKNSA